MGEGDFPGEGVQFSWGAIFRGALFQGGNIPGNIFPEGIFPGTFFLEPIKVSTHGSVR